MAETATIADMADIISRDIFKWFKWERLDLMDQNFSCQKIERHAAGKSSHTHPVDVLFHYIDPYLNKRILFNTDLKSYADKSITTDRVRKSLQSLAKTIDCARVSQEWKIRYDIFSEKTEIRGLLFIYNHDGEFDENFYRFFYKDEKNQKRQIIKTESLPLSRDQQIHIVEPALINYMTTLIGDINQLHQEGSFPKQSYYFYYPDLYLHKAHGIKENRPATIEMINSPYLIIGHDDVKSFNEEKNRVEITYSKGFVIYYNRPGSTYNEFLYLFDTLSKYQILDSESLIRIRVANSKYHQDIRSNFNNAIMTYANAWGFDETKREKLNRIEFGVVETRKTRFSQVELGWRNI